MSCTPAVGDTALPAKAEKRFEEAAFSGGLHVIRWHYGLLGTKEFLTSVGNLSGRNTISYPVCYAVVGCLAPFVNRDVDAVCKKEKTGMKGSLVFMRENVPLQLYERQVLCIGGQTEFNTWITEKCYHPILSDTSEVLIMHYD